MVKPLSELTITQPFGARPEYYGLGGHPGVDFRTKYTNPNNSWWNNLMGYQPCYAIEDGQCVATYNKTGYGTHIWLNDKYLYAHLKNAKSNETAKVIGDKLFYQVKKGDIIGITGNTGNSTAAHLHFGYRPQGLFVNPMQLFENSTQPLKIAFVNAEIAQIEEFLAKVREYTNSALSCVWERFGVPTSVPSGTFTTEQAMKLIDGLKTDAKAFFIFYSSPNASYEVASYHPARNAAFATVPNGAPTTVLVHAFLHCLRKYINFNHLGPYIEDVEKYPTNWSDAANFNNEGWKFAEQYQQLQPYFPKL